MQRLITGYRKDEENHWVALLGCGHAQHVRHHPPLKSRRWVLTDAGRRRHIGTPLHCVRCEHFELPPHFLPYKRTPIFTQDTLPDGLRRDHSTASGVWARIVVMEGRLRYRVPTLGFDEVLTPNHPGVVVPEVPHSVDPLCAAQFFLEFFAEPKQRPRN
jgi:tellurite methyltransferase